MYASTGCYIGNAYYDSFNQQAALRQQYQNTVLGGLGMSVSGLSQLNLQTAQVAAKKKGWVRRMFDSIKEAIGSFFKENQSIILWIAVLFLADHFFFAGKFRARLHALVEGMIAKVETKVQGVL